jgi:TonB family protein
MRNIPYEKEEFDLLCSDGGTPMTYFIRAMRSIFCSILFISMACESIAVFGSGLKRTEPCKQQATDGDNLREVSKKALSASEGMKSFRMRIEYPTHSKTPVTIWEYASPNRVRFTKGNEEMIKIGKDVYHRKDAGSWVKYSEKDNGEVKTEVAATVLKQFIGMIENADEIKFIGRETVDGIPARIYKYTKYAGPNKTAPSTTMTWINEANGLLLKHQFYRLVTDSTLSHVDHTFYDYNADIKIEPPTQYVSVTAPDKGEGAGPGPGNGFNTGGGKPNPNVPASGADQKPVALNFPRPNYTEEARHNKVEGMVRLRVLVGTDGIVKQVRVNSGLPDGLNEEAILCAYQIRFKPAMKDGQPVPFWVGVDIEFNLVEKVR